MAVFGVICGRIFLYLDWIQVYGLNLQSQPKSVKCKVEKTPNADTFSCSEAGNIYDKQKATSQLALVGSKLTRETLEQGLEFVES